MSYFGQHIAVAEQQLVRYATAAGVLETRVRLGRLRATPVTEEEIRADEGTPPSVLAVQYEAQDAWHELWTHLDEAREAAAASGRDTGRFDALRAASREHAVGVHVDFGPWRAGRQLRSQEAVPYVRSVTCLIGPPTLAEDAMLALRATMPEIEIPRADLQPVADLRRSRAVLWVLGALIATVTILLAVLALR